MVLVHSIARNRITLARSTTHKRKQAYVHNPRMQRWSRGHKARGQGRGQNLLRPRTGMLEAEDTGASVLKKNVFKNIFQAISNSSAYPKFLIKEGLNHMIWRHQSFSKEEVFAGQRYRRMKDLKSLLPVCTKPEFGKGRGLKLIVEKCKYLTLGTCWKSYCNSNVSQTGVWGRGPQPPEALGVWGRSPQPLGNFLEKKAILMPSDHISQVFRAI